MTAPTPSSASSQGWRRAPPSWPPTRVPDQLQRRRRQRSGSRRCRECCAAVTAFDQSAVRGQVFQASDLFGANDRDGDRLLYFFYDSSADPPGPFHGQRRDPGRRYDLRGQRGVARADDLHRGVAGSDDLFVNTLDGLAFSGPQEFDVNVPANHAPTATAMDQSAARGQVFNASPLPSVIDADGDSLLHLFYDNSADPTRSGYSTSDGADPGRQYDLRGHRGAARADHLHRCLAAVRRPVR